MAYATALPARRPLWLRLFYLVPVFGWIAKDTSSLATTPG